MRTITALQRRHALLRRHRLAGDADGPESVTSALLALHATDPASVYLSVLVRSAGSTIGEVSAAMYERRRLVRWLAMRRTLFVFDRDDVPVVQSAVGDPLADTLRRRLVARIGRNGTRPTVPTDVEQWLAGVERDVDAAITELSSATGAELAAAVPALGTVLLARTASEQEQRLTSSVLTIVSAAGRIVRATPTGAWTSRHHRWEPVHAWWPGGLPPVEPGVAERELARRWLERFGPATLEDLQWRTGWTKTTTNRAVSALPLDDVDLDGRPGVALADVDIDLTVDDSAAVATLLPALDPTPMGWKHRDWFLACDPAPLYDRAGNIGPTVWWNGELVGGWAMAASGEIRTRLLVDRGRAVHDAVDRAGADLHARLDCAVVTPAARTPLERSLAEG